MNALNFPQPYKSQLQLVQKQLKASLISSEESGLQEIGQHLSQSPGKQVRALLTLIAAEYGTERPAPEQLLTLATGIECIHLASLIHDDIIDEADTRRDQPSIQAKYGNNEALISGVYVYALALKQITSIGNIPLLEEISTAVETLCEGEFAQMTGRFTIPTLDEYYRIIHKKTAVLFKAALKSGALLANADPNTQKTLSKVGQELGIIFQLTDDTLDLYSQGKHLKKDPCQDILEGEFTLPTLLIVQKMNAAEQDHLQTLLSQSPEKARVFIQDRATEKIRMECLQIIQNHLEHANKALTALSNQDGTVLLQKILNKVAERVSET